MNAVYEPLYFVQYLRTESKRKHLLSLMTVAIIFPSKSLINTELDPVSDQNKWP